MIYYIHFRCTTQQFSICIYCEILLTVSLVSISHHIVTTCFSFLGSMTFPCCHSYWNTSVLHSSKLATQALWCGLALVLSAVLIIVTLICVSIISPFLWKVKSHTQLWQCTWVVCLRTPSVFTHVRQPLKVWASIVPIQSLQSLRHVWLFATLWTAIHQASLSLTNSWSLLKLMSIESVMPSSHLILCHPLLLLPPIPPSIGVFPNESVLCIRWPKYWSFSFNISPFNEYLWLISFRILLALSFIIPIIQIKKKTNWGTDRPSSLLEDASVSEHHSRDWLQDQLVPECTASLLHSTHPSVQKDPALAFFSLFSLSPPIRTVFGIWCYFKKFWVNTQMDAL